jgi:peptide/nickel transport system substrate-binding protein
MRKKGFLAVLAVVLVGLFVFAGCRGNRNEETTNQPGGQVNQQQPGTSTPPSAPAGTPIVSSRDTITILGASLPVSLLPWGGNDSASSEINKQMYSQLFVLDYATFEIVPERSLAVAWNQPNASTTEIRIRDNVYFHNGDKLTARDVAWSLLQGQASPHTSAFLGMISDVEVVDDYNLIVRTEMDFAPILRHLAHTGSSIAPYNLLGKTQEEFVENPIGSGPFRFDQLILGDRIELVANTNYWGQAPYINRLVYRSVADASVRLMEIEAGTADVALGIAPADIARAEADPNVQLIRRQNLSTAYIGFNVNRPYINNPLVRQAINYALDTHAIVEHVFMGVGSPVDGPIADIVWGFSRQEPFTTNLDRARQLMVEAGYPDGFKTSIWWNIGNQQREQIATMVQFALAPLGIEVEIVSMEWAAILDATLRGEQDCSSWVG